MTEGDVAVTVIVPSYNYARYLPQRLDSILNQTFRDFEVVIIDDASTDESVDVIAAFSDNPRIRTVLCPVNSGSVYQRWNEGAALARGRYLWFAGADDYCESTLLDELVALLETDHSRGVAFSQSWMIDESGRRLFRAPEWSRSGTREGRHARRVLMFDTTIANASAVLLRRDIFQEVGGFDLGFPLAADWKLYLEFLNRSHLAYVAKPLNFCRMHEATVSIKARRSGAEAAERYRLIAELAARYEDLGHLREAVLDREAQRCLVLAANAIRRGSFLPAMRILSAGSSVDPRHGRRMLQNGPSLVGAIWEKLAKFGAQRLSGVR